MSIISDFSDIKRRMEHKPEKDTGPTYVAGSGGSGFAVATVITGAAGSGGASATVPDYDARTMSDNLVSETSDDRRFPFMGSPTIITAEPGLILHRMPSGMICTTKIGEKYPSAAIESGTTLTCYPPSS